jgi:hypothetical protein
MIHGEDTATGLQIGIAATSKAAHTLEQGVIGGERNTSSATNNYTVVHNECNITRLDIDQTETLVTNAPAFLIFAVGNDGNTGYSDFLDAAATGGGSTPKARVNLGDGVNPMYFGGARFETGICVDGESVGHDITIGWRPIT